MNGIIGTIIVLFIMMWGCATCVSTDRPARTIDSMQTNIIVQSNAADGLDLKGLAALATTVKNPEELERKINEPDGINNLDLNEDNVVDFIKVTEYRETDQYGLSLTTEPVQGEEQEIATIEMIKTGETVDMNVAGNQQIYGANQYYHSSFANLAMVGMMGYFIGNAMAYRSPYRFGYYPSYYSSYRPIGRDKYRGRMSSSYYPRTSASKVSTFSRPSTLTNPNRGKVASNGITKPLSNPTSAQKSFQTRNPSKTVRSGGFGGNRSATTRGSSSGSVRNRSSSRSFGGRGK